MSQVAPISDLKTQVWQAISDPVRRSMLDELQTQTLTTTDICDRFEQLTRYQVMGHLTVLREAGLVSTQKRGRERLNSLNAAPLGEAYDDWLRKFEVEWAGRLGRLKRQVENQQEEEKTMDAIAPAIGLSTIEFEKDIEIFAPPSAVFIGLTDGIGNWFGAPFLQTGDDATDMLIEPKPGGKWIETTKGGGGALWGEVQEIRRDTCIALEGRMGIRPAVFGRIVFTLTPRPEGGGTILTLQFHAIGHFQADHEALYTGGLNELFAERLKAYAEGKPVHGVRNRS